jgi:choline-sulfatase
LGVSIPAKEHVKMAITDLFQDGNKPNIVIIITDQQRALQHYPDDFLDKLPSLKLLKDNGLSFERAFTAACACAPSRASLLTSQYPAKHGTTNTGQKEPIKPLNLGLNNLARVLEKAGYQTRAWIGKWHLGEQETNPVAAGFTQWNESPELNDAGITIGDYKTLGGGASDFDNKYLADMKSFIDKRKEINEPFCLVASFVNPHDGFVAHNGLEFVNPTTGITEISGYQKENFNEVFIPMPSNFGASLLKTPRAQISTNWWNLPNYEGTPSPQDYVNFYAYLQTLVDGQIMQLLDSLNSAEFFDNTLVIRLADHGEMALSHGLIEKFFNAYEEIIRIPLIFSKFPQTPSNPEPGQTTDALASLVDVTPTLAALLGVTPTGFDGQDLSPIFEDPSRSVQDSIHFTYDDNPGRGPSIVRTVRTAKWKYSVYFTLKGDDADWELYNLLDDPNELTNLAGNVVHSKTQATLETQLVGMMNRLGTMPTAFKWPPLATSASKGVTPK